MPAGGKSYGGRFKDAHREAEVPKRGKEGGNSSNVTGADTAGFGGPKRYGVHQEKGTENAAPTSGNGR